MSANRWGACPACQEKLTAVWEEQERALKAAYGVTTKDVYAELVRSHPKRCPEVDHTFREDYEIGVNLQGEFSVQYLGQCTECEYTRSFSYPSGIVGHGSNEWMERKLNELYLKVSGGVAEDSLNQIAIIGAKFRNLQRIVNQIPRTKDGVPILPGMTVYGLSLLGEILVFEVNSWAHVAQLTAGGTCNWWSTRELAEGAA